MVKRRVAHAGANDFRAVAEALVRFGCNESDFLDVIRRVFATPTETELGWLHEVWLERVKLVGG